MPSQVSSHARGRYSDKSRKRLPTIFATKADDPEKKHFQVLLWRRRDLYLLPRKPFFLSDAADVLGTIVDHKLVELVFLGSAAPDHCRISRGGPSRGQAMPPTVSF